MAKITEDCVSFETAKLLKEKGFKEKCYGLYQCTDYVVPLKVYSFCTNHNNTKRNFSMPTQAMAIKWLREVHSLHIYIGHSAGKCLSWYYEIHGISDGKVKHIGGIQCGSYEVACEEAIRYCLENLI